MQSTTFIGEVRQGRLHIAQPLAEFDGKQVLVTLIAPDIPLPQPAANVGIEESHDELDIEVEVYAPMPVTAENLGTQSIRTVAANPCLILPEGINDD